MRRGPQALFADRTAQARSSDSARFLAQIGRSASAEIMGVRSHIRVDRAPHAFLNRQAARVKEGPSASRGRGLGARRKHQREDCCRLAADVGMIGPGAFFPGLGPMRVVPVCSAFTRAVPAGAPEFARDFAERSGQIEAVGGAVLFLMERASASRIRACLGSLISGPCAL